MMASYRFALFCNHSCSLGLSLALSPCHLSRSPSLIAREEERKLFYILAVSPETVFISAWRVCLWAMKKLQKIIMKYHFLNEPEHANFSEYCMCTVMKHPQINIYITSFYIFSFIVLETAGK